MYNLYILLFQPGGFCQRNFLKKLRRFPVSLTWFNQLESLLPSFVSENNSVSRALSQTAVNQVDYSKFNDVSEEYLLGMLVRS